MVFQHDVGLAVDLGAEAAFGIFGGEDDARFASAQGRLHFGGGIADGRDDADPGDDDAAHGASLAGLTPV
jgi:hypothetical protein